MDKQILDLRKEYAEKYGFSVPDKSVHKTEPGLSQKVIREMSEIKGEKNGNEWIHKFRLRGLDHFLKRPLPKWGGDLSSINFDDITYYIKPTDKQEESWEELPPEIKNTFDKLGIPEAERKFLAGVGVQFDSENVYHSLKKDLEKKGVIFVGPDEGLQKYPHIFKKWFGSIIPPEDNKFSALNSAFFSGGSFIYIPPGVEVKQPLQAYFRINAEGFGQFERTLIIVDEGAKASYVEGCTAPIYSKESLHAAVVEVIALPGSHFRYTTLQNWSNNVYNLVTKRAHAFEGAIVEWLDANIGCLAGDTKVFTNSNIKDISTVEEGDIIYSLDQNFEITKQKVIAKKINEPTDIFKLTTSNYREVKATSNHPFLVLEKIGTLNYIRWKQLKEIKEGDNIACVGNLPDDGKPYKINFVQKRGETINTPFESSKELLWLLGFYMGDGYKDKNRVCFAVSEKDKSREKVIENVNKLFGIEKFEKRGVVVRFNSVAFVDFLSSLGFHGKAKDKRVPQWIYTLPKEQKLAFIEGYIDADGYARKGHKNVSITSVNRNLLEDTKLLAISCGLNPSKVSKWSRKEKKPLGKEEKTYEHYFLYFGDKAFNTSLYFSKVLKVEHVGKEITYDIEVSGSANFIANGIFAHNSKLTMKYPSVFLRGPRAKADILSVAFAGKGQHQDTGGKVVHLAPHTTSKLIAKSVSKDGGRTTYRGLLHVSKLADNVKSTVRCDALLLDEISKTDTYPYNEVNNESATITHEATVGKIGEQQLFYLMSRGLNEQEALSMIVSGFFDAFAKEIPLEYAVEFNRLIQLEMTGSVG